MPKLLIEVMVEPGLKCYNPDLMGGRSDPFCASRRPMESQFDPYLEWLGIEPHEHPVDHYRLLGVSRFEQNLGAIRLAAQERMDLVEGFAQGPQGQHCVAILNQLAEAKLCLMDDQSKARYDEQLSAGRVEAAESIPISLTDSAGGGRTPAMTNPAESSATRIFSKIAILFSCVSLGVLIGLTIVYALSRATGNPSAPPAQDHPPVQVTRDDLEEAVLVSQEGSGEINLLASVAQTHGPELEMPYQDGQTVISNWNSPRQWMNWRFNVIRPGVFRVLVEYQVAAGEPTGEYTLSIDDEDQKVCPVSSGEGNAPIVDEHRVAIPAKGEHFLILRAKSIPGTSLMTVRGIRLIPDGEAIDKDSSP